ncbi:hypothetical protein FHR24_003120 [Wenyingzhuangia heitensis]|uniref:DUF4105 domain-containing protein n=1 Tax=Wenyingzhuangia heitensis TaxID=1487859 RepID=A0ABX0UFH7_9FLAO|nr:DUF4105 domain-containing protein [Wenyingzhuangia heitensis]NIJ46625.1 hypothetical protein [Wenyingzhuangia heitensis]
MKKIILIIFLLGQLNYVYGQFEISILTCSPGQKVYSVFGHTAIRIFNREKNIDQVYNFGMFDFKTTNFEYKYLKGKLEYFRGIQKTDNFIKSYTSEERLIIEQVLELNEFEIKKIINRLNFLYRPQNKFYLYSFLKKNCSTETRDLLSYIGVRFKNQKIKKSNRALINSYLKEMSWLKLGINLVLGKSLDKISTRSQSMFLPNYLQKEIKYATLNDKRIVKYEKNLNSIKKTNHLNPLEILPSHLLFSFIVLIIIFWFPKQIRLIISLVIGVTGFFFLVLWMFSGHEEVKNNLNIIWCNPLYLIYIPLIVQNKINKVLSLILLGTIVSSTMIWLLKIQVFDSSIIPILILLGILNFKQMKKEDEIIRIKK